MTPGAVSRQIKALEDELNVKLFIRHGNSVQLTQVGEDLFTAIASTFARCSEAIQSARFGFQYNSVTLACTDAFATFWLTPKIQDFWQRFPDVAVNHLISDNVRDFRRAEVDLRIRPGKGAWANETAELLFGDTMYPVCGVEFAAAHQGVQAEDLPALPLLQMDWTDPEWPRWEEFFRTVAIAHIWRRGRRFGKYSLLLAAAEANQGVALGWDALVRPLVDAGRLVKLTALSVPAPIEYYLTWNDNRVLSQPTRQVRDWIIEQACGVLKPD